MTGEKDGRNGVRHIHEDGGGGGAGGRVVRNTTVMNNTRLRKTTSPTVNCQ